MNRPYALLVTTAFLISLSPIHAIALDVSSPSDDHATELTISENSLEDCDVVEDQSCAADEYVVTDIKHAIPIDHEQPLDSCGVVTSSSEPDSESGFEELPPLTDVTTLKEDDSDTRPTSPLITSSPDESITLTEDISTQESDLNVSEEQPLAEASADIELPQNEARDSDGASGQSGSGTNVWRLYNPNSGEHFYTTSLNEAKHLVSVGWNWEGCGWVAPDSGRNVYRLYNPNAGDHHYTENSNERDWLVSLGWRYEGVGWLSGGDVSVLRQYNPNATSGAHNFTTNVSENGSLVKAGWSDEGTGWKALAARASSIAPFWIVRDDGDRFWVQSDTQLARNRIVSAQEGTGYDVYATSDGTIVRGAVDMGDYVYLADEIGRLPSNEGWLVTDAFGQGLQRYWLEKLSNGVYAAREGYSAKGYPHYTIPGKGYVVRGSYSLDGYTYIADNSGRMPTSTGWLSSDAFSGTSSKYYMISVKTGGVAAKTGFFSVGGTSYYAFSDGSVGDVPAMYPDMFYKAQGYSSSTGFLILVDCSGNRVAVYQNNNGSWIPIKEWRCTTGAYYTPTVKGSFTVTGKGYSFGSGYTCYYYTQFYGNYLFHSVLYYQGTFNVMDGRLGISASHGCVRLAIENAKWIYDNIPYGTRVVTYS